eukprot:TRINITY_DN155_c0_g1_i3.p1 TRINITY_DN155_c0_g1~~TRINITY_DN155_c0_g1_i3.p1  ORF type:complete len:220 (-),score=76.60 TRINITY_DN155_c0_g1_i3:315-974(-)
MLRSLVGSEMCIRDRYQRRVRGLSRANMPFTLYYHTACTGFYGRGWAPLAMLKHAKAEHDIKEPQDAPEGSGFAPPMVGFPEGHTIAQTNAICAAVGRAVGLAPESAADQAKADQLVADAGDITGEVFGGKPAERLNKWLEYLAGNVKENGYFLESGLSYADFAIVPLLKVIAGKQSKGNLEGVVVPEPLLKWEERMGALDAVAELNASGVPILPDAML